MQVCLGHSSRVNWNKHTPTHVCIYAEYTQTKAHHQKTLNLSCGHVLQIHFASMSYRWSRSEITASMSALVTSSHSTCTYTHITYRTKTSAPHLPQHQRSTNHFKPPRLNCLEDYITVENDNFHISSVNTSFFKGNWVGQMAMSYFSAQWLKAGWFLLGWPQKAGETCTRPQLLFLFTVMQCLCICVYIHIHIYAYTHTYVYIMHT